MNGAASERTIGDELALAMSRVTDREPARPHEKPRKPDLLAEGDAIAEDAKARAEHDRKHGLVSGRKGTAGGAFKKSLAATAVDTAMAPVTLPARALRAVGVDNAAADLSGEKLLEDLEHISSGTAPAQVRRDRQAERTHHPTATAAGEFAGDAVASAIPGGVIAAKNAAAARRALALSNPRAFQALRTREQRGVISLDRATKVMARHEDLPNVQQFLNEDRAVASLLEREGFDAAAKRYGADRAKRALDATRGATRALKAAAETADDQVAVVYRGEKSPGKIPKAGETITTKHTWSVSEDAQHAGAFAGDGGVLYEIRQKRSAVPVDGVPGSNTFNEALIPARSKMRVAGTRQEGGLTVVTLEEAVEKARNFQKELKAALKKGDREAYNRIKLDEERAFAQQLGSKNAPPAAPAQVPESSAADRVLDIAKSVKTKWGHSSIPEMRDAANAAGISNEAFDEAMKELYDSGRLNLQYHDLPSFQENRGKFFTLPSGADRGFEGKTWYHAAFVPEGR